MPEPTGLTSPGFPRLCRSIRACMRARARRSRSSSNHVLNLSVWRTCIVGTYVSYRIQTGKAPLDEPIRVGLPRAAACRGWFTDQLAASGNLTTVEFPDVKAIRKALLMSQHRFAAVSRIPLQTLTNWEHGSQTLSASVTRHYSLPRVARAWKISCASVFRFLNEMQSNTIARRSPGLVGTCSDAGLADYTRRQLDARRVRRLILPPLKWSDSNDVF